MIKKLILTIIINFFLSQVAFALTKEDAIKKYFSNKKLELIEGIWSEIGTKYTSDFKILPKVEILITKTLEGYQIIYIHHPKLKSGTLGPMLRKETESYFQGKSYLYYPDGSKKSCDMSLVVTLVSAAMECDDGTWNIGYNFQKVWPKK